VPILSVIGMPSRKIRADVLRRIGDVGRGGRLLGEHVDAAGQTLAEQIGLDERQFEAARARAVLDGGARESVRAPAGCARRCSPAEQSVGGRSNGARRIRRSDCSSTSTLNHDAIGRRSGSLVILTFLK